MADTTNIKNIRRRILGPSKRELHSTLVHQKKLETGHHAQLENFLTNHGLLLVQIIQSLGQLASAIDDIRDRVHESQNGEPSLSQVRLDALESIVDALALQRQAADSQPVAGWMKDHPVIKEMEDVKAQLAGIAGQSLLPQLVGMSANVENALLNISAMVSELVGGGLAARLELMQNDVAELGVQMRLQAGHAEGLNTLLDAQNAQVRGIGEDLRATVTASASQPFGELSGRLESMANALSNLGSLTGRLAGEGLAGRLERIEQNIASLDERQNAKLAGVDGLIGKFEAQQTQWRAGQEQLNAQLLAAGGVASETSGKIDNVSNALLNIATMVSGLVGDGTASRLDRIERMQGDLAIQIRNLSQALEAVGACIDEELMRREDPAGSIATNAR